MIYIYLFQANSYRYFVKEIFAESEHIILELIYINQIYFC